MYPWALKRVHCTKTSVFAFYFAVLDRSILKWYAHLTVFFSGGEHQLPWRSAAGLHTDQVITCCRVGRSGGEGSDGWVKKEGGRWVGSGGRGEEREGHR